MARTDPKTGIELGWPRGDDAWGTGMNSNLERLIYTGYRLPVKGIASDPPSAPQEGDSYLVGANPSDAWQTFSEGDFAVYGLLPTTYTALGWIRYQIDANWTGARIYRTDVSKSYVCLLYTSPSPRD